MKLIFAALSYALVATGSAWGQAYPTKPVRLVIGGLPGTAPDIIARIIGPSMTESMGQSLILDNRGAGAASSEHRSPPPRLPTATLFSSSAAAAS